MDENNLPQSDWRDALLSLQELEEEEVTPATSAVPLGDTQPIAQVTDAASGETSELDRIMRELQNMELDQTAPVSSNTETEIFKDDDFRAAFGEGEELMNVFSDEPMSAISADAPAEEEEIAKADQGKKRQVNIQIQIMKLPIK